MIIILVPTYTSICKIIYFIYCIIYFVNILTIYRYNFITNGQVNDSYYKTKLRILLKIKDKVKSNYYIFREK